jgi:hypothetical protein
MEHVVIFLLLASFIYCIILMNENSQLKRENSEMKKTVEDMKKFYMKFWQE